MTTVLDALDHRHRCGWSEDDLVEYIISRCLCAHSSILECAVWNMLMSHEFNFDLTIRILDVMLTSHIAWFRSCTFWNIAVDKHAWKVLQMYWNRMPIPGSWYRHMCTELCLGHNVEFVLALRQQLIRVGYATDMMEYHCEWIQKVRREVEHYLIPDVAWVALSWV